MELKRTGAFVVECFRLDGEDFRRWAMPGTRSVVWQRLHVRPDNDLVKYEFMGNEWVTLGEVGKSIDADRMEGLYENGWAGRPDRPTLPKPDLTNSPALRHGAEERGDGKVAEREGGGLQ